MKNWVRGELSVEMACSSLRRQYEHAIVWVVFLPWTSSAPEGVPQRDQIVTSKEIPKGWHGLISARLRSSIHRSSRKTRPFYGMAHGIFEVDAIRVAQTCSRRCGRLA